MRGRGGDIAWAMAEAKARAAARPLGGGCARGCLSSQPEPRGASAALAEAPGSCLL